MAGVCGGGGHDVWDMNRWEGWAITVRHREIFLSDVKTVQEYYWLG